MNVEKEIKKRLDNIFIQALNRVAFVIDYVINDISNTVTSPSGHHCPMG